MATERLSNLSLGMAILLSFVVVALCFSFFATMNNTRSGVATERDLASKKAIYIQANPKLNGS